MDQHDHSVHFYESDSHIVETVSHFAASGLDEGGAVVVIATKAHRDAIGEQLTARGIDLSAALEQGKLVALDAAELASELVVGGALDPGRFFACIESILARAAAGGRRLRVYGEMVAVLWAEGHGDATILSEALWNQVVESRSLDLLCGYPLERFHREAHAGPFSRICAEHRRVIPGASYMGLPSEGERLGAIAALQQKARALEEENTARKEIEVSLVRRDEFLAMLAHELRNPLAPMHMAVELARRQGPDAAVLRHLDMIDRQTERLTRLVDDLLDVSRITSGKIELRKQRADMVAIVSRALEATRGLMEQRRHEVSVRVPPGRLELLVDPLRLEQVLVNLLVNAAKYTEPGGRVCVTLERTRDAIELRVQDTGIGLEREMLDRMFDLFRQAERSLDRAQGGLGIGLTIARRLVELHGGTIDARSEGRGQGAELIVRLSPALELPETSAIGAIQADLRRPAACHCLPILVVDDDVDAAETLSEILRNLGHEVRVAHDGESAIHVAAEFRPRLVLLDLGLPGKDGYEVAKKLRAVGPEARLIAVTGYGQAKDRKRTAAAGFQAHLIKPVQMDVLSSILEDAGWIGPC